MNKNFKTEQEKFWASEFGDSYIERNKSNQLFASNINFFIKALQRAHGINSCIEFGANVGMNLHVLNLIYPTIELTALEINQKASSILKNDLPKTNVINLSILEYQEDRLYDLAMVKGVLIHINPSYLNQVYEKIYKASRKYILIGEYYNPAPVSIEYRGHKEKLFKRDFAGEMLDMFNDLKLLDYGFSYYRDNSFPQDDITWFLLEKI